MDPLSPTLKRFPLVKRIRPACLPLPTRVTALAARARDAAQTNDQRSASVVCNQAALLASDIGLPHLARTLCIDHANAFLDSCPLPAREAQYGLEPLVNLGRLHIRDQRPDEGRAHLTAMYNAVTNGTTVTLDSVTIPASLTSSDEDRQEVRKWLWTVLLADGTRTLTSTGRWNEALAHIEKHNGIGTRMLDGRQVAVIAALTNSDHPTALDLVSATTPGDWWEQLLTAMLHQVALRDAGDQPPKLGSELAERFLKHPPEDGLTLPRTRLGMSILHTLGATDEPAALQVAADLYATALRSQDGYAARELLACPKLRTLLTSRQLTQLVQIKTASALDAGHMDPTLLTSLVQATQTSLAVISAPAA
ncbi:hypothetical protein [Streptacidiphilus neutrinimicus]|uniref:hypothetical protein n=1 Tax=Streptacidiphilus neutrinimicus TaxID=105420 RepID=UPI000AE56667|nr:hypothetical protein [Streptacidiphilus neutrinimicus]